MSVAEALAAVPVAQHRQVVIDLWNGNARDELITALAGQSGVQSVDIVRLDLEPDVFVVDITSRYESDDIRRDLAWEPGRAIAEFWDVEDAVFRHPDWSPAFRLTVSGIRHDCPAELMGRLADVLASQTDWETGCITTQTAADPAPPTTADPGIRQLESDIARQAQQVAVLESQVAADESWAANELSDLQRRLDDTRSVGAVNGAVALEGEIARVNEELSSVRAELDAARAELRRLESLR